VGEATAHVAEGARAAGLKEERVRGFSSREEMVEALASALAPGDVVLIKGSRSSRMEEVSDRLRARLAAARERSAAPPPPNAAADAGEGS